MTCEHCRADPQPPGFGSPRNCAFDDKGTFTPDNWNCATLEALPEMDAFRANSCTHGDSCLDGSDESMQLVKVPEERGSGWIVLTRYKHRGKCSSAIYVGAFWPPVPLDLEFAERLIEDR